MTALGFVSVFSRFEPLISDSAEDGEEPAGGDGDELAVWCQSFALSRTTYPTTSGYAFRDDKEQVCDGSFRYTDNELRVMVNGIPVISRIDHTPAKRNAKSCGRFFSSPIPW